MATGGLSQSYTAASPAPARSLEDGLSLILSALASLKLTVALFALSIFLVFMGTLAQKDQGVWEVVEQTYFRVWFARIDFQSFLRLFQMWTKTEAPPIPGGFWFPGGLTLGSLLGLNLLAAHSIRFKVAARGQRRLLGLGVIGVGLASAAVLIAADQRGAVEGVFSPGVQAGLWHLLRGAAAAIALFAGYLVVSAKHGLGTIEKVIAGAIAAIAGAIAFWLYTNPGVRLDPSGLRILWILGLCSLVSAVLLAGCGLLFKKRAGIVLIHAGVLLLMVGELLTGLAADEGQMQIREGESTNYALDIRTTELAVVDSSGEQKDVVTVVPQHFLTGEETIVDDALPFDIRPLKFLKNSFLAPSTGAVENPATKGAGLGLVAVPMQAASGVDMNAGVDLPSAYVKLLKKGSDESLGVYLVSNSGDRTGSGLKPQVVEVDGRPYELQLRFKRQYKPYSVELVDFRFDRYAGSDMAKNFSSDVVIHDPLRSIDRKTRIWMNNPTRHAGDTLYQQSYDKATEAATVLQVVTNTGRLIPYLSCAMVGLGLLAHFGQTLVRFIRRREAETAKALAAAPRDEHARGFDWQSPAVLIPLAVAGLLVFYAIGKARPVVDAPDAMPVQRFGALAMVDNGRVKPYDTYARNMLQRISNRQEIHLDKLPQADRPECAGQADKVSAIRWMLDVVSGSKGAEDYRVFRIDNLDVLSALGLDARPGSYRYSLKEVTQDLAELDRQLNLASEVPENERTLFHNKLAELSAKLGQYRLMEGAFKSPGVLGRAEGVTGEYAERVAEFAVQLRRAGAPLPAPPDKVDAPWTTVVDAEIEYFLALRSNREGNPATPALLSVLLAYRQGDIRAFSESLDDLETTYARHQKQLRSPLNEEAVAALKPAERLNIDKSRFEKFFSQYSPFTTAAALYLAAFFFSVCSWLVWPRTLGRTAMAIVIVALLIHTFAILGRLYISGRPPVTNLYSSAVFIGWAMVVFGLVVDAFYRLGIGTALGSAAGFLTMLVAYFLGLDGDSFTVMQAVLDTQFWLATHVICVTVGYSATFWAGAFGLAYIGYRNPALFCLTLLAGLMLAFVFLDNVPTYLLVGAPVVLLGLASALGRLKRPDDSAAIERMILRMTYGALCFALFFSFIGTVLGGLWADDSWGRFWGWDPKENGALIIVLWNALILHARWGALVSSRGLAALAVAGNIVTMWSWFGVNELGVGLHAYGGVSEGLSLGMSALTIVLLTHLPLIALAFLPRDAWKRASQEPAVA